MIELGKMTKKKQIEKIPTNIENLLIKNEKNLWQVTHLNKFVLEVGRLGIKNAETVKAIIKNFPNKEMLIYETEKILSNEDIKEIYNYHDYRTCMANAILLKSGVCIDYAITLYNR